MATYPTPPAPSKPKGSSGGSSSSRGSSSSSGSRGSRGSSGRSSGSSGGGGGSDPYARVRADQKAQEAKAATRLSQQGRRLAEQAAALKLALGSKGLRAELSRQLKNADLEFREEDATILSQYERGKKSLERQAATTEDQLGQSLSDAGSNAGRERNEALQQGVENGISATDMIKAQAASLRNWSFNAGQAQTNYTDEMNGLQSEHDQMVNTVVTSRQSAWREREQQRAQLYRGYYDSRGQVLTEIGNKYGESAQYYDMANEQKSSKTYTGKAKSSNKTAMANLRAAALETGKGYSERATPKSITKWQGTAKLENTTDPRQWGDQTLEVKDAEGATGKLRKWES